MISIIIIIIIIIIITIIITYLRLSARVILNINLFYYLLNRFTLHYLTHHSTNEERYCDKCDFGTYAEILYKRHCETNKHIL